MIERGENFLLLRSADTQATYVVRLEAGRRGEELTAAPLSAFLEPTRALTAGEREKAEKKPAKPRKKREPKGGVPKGTVTPAGRARRDAIVSVLGDETLPMREINTRMGNRPNDPDLYGHVERMVKDGELIQVEESAEINGRNITRRSWRVGVYANSPSGPGSDQRSSEPQPSSN